MKHGCREDKKEEKITDNIATNIADNAEHSLTLKKLLRKNLLAID